jgi:hypothetical protein
VGVEKEYIFNQCAISVGALKKAGDTEMATKVANGMNKWLNEHKSKLNLPIPNMMHPMVPQDLVKSRPSFKTATDIVLRESPIRVIVNQCPVDDNLNSGPDSKMASNRAFMKCIYHFQSGNKDVARQCWDHAMKKCDGVGFFDSGDDTRPGHSTYKMAIQHIAANITGFGPKKAPDILGKMQDSNGAVHQFFDKDLKYTQHHNSEATSLSILAALSRSGSSSSSPSPSPSPSPPSSSAKASYVQVPYPSISIGLDSLLFD